MSDKPTLYYIHDPMCSWCWGYQPVLKQILASQSNQLNIVPVLGGLAPDTDEIMPIALQKEIAAHWHHVEQELGTEFNHAFWKNCQSRRSTYPACRAVIAARKQAAGQEMIFAIQQAYYLRAMNPSDEDTLLQLADELELDFDRFAIDLNSDEVQAQLLYEVALARKLNVQGFPSWVLQYAGNHTRILVDYQSAHVTLAAISAVLKS